MELKKYRLGDIAEIIGGVSYSPKDICTGGIRILRGGNIQNQHIELKTDDVFLPISYKNNISQIYVGDTILVASTGSVDVLGKAATCFQYTEDVQIGAFLRIIRPKADKYTMLISSALSSDYFKRYIKAQAKGTSINNITLGYLRDFEIYAPHDFTGLSHLSANIENKICLNRAINDNLEAMAKQFYDYWFVQFDFPNEEGKPYKSNGGVMVWNEDLHMSIPCTWNTCLLSDYIGSNNTGDWGFDEPAKKRSIKVGCIRGADIVKLNDLPIRYIKDNNTSKLLSAWDIVIEVSGGSPTQATGRSAFVTPGVLKRNGGNLTCSNFCHAFTMKDYKASAYFYFMWRMFYDNNNMFNFEGKTSGIKNFMTDTFLANKWLDVPTALLDLFFERVKVIYEQIDNNLEEINALTKQRDELLPLLMNGQATVNYHLSAC